MIYRITINYTISPEPCLGATRFCGLLKLCYGGHAIWGPPASGCAPEDGQAATEGPPAGPGPNTHRPLQCPHPGCGKWFKGPRLLDRHFKGHEGLADGECLKCGREFNFVTALRYHCKHRCGPESLPKRHIPQKGKEALEWAALLAPAAGLEQLLDGEEDGQPSSRILCSS